MISISLIITKKKKSLWVLILALILLIASVLFWQSFQGSQSITIGGIAPLADDPTNIGHTIKEVANLRIQEWNNSIKVGGKSFNIIWKDGKCDYETSKKAAQELINKYHTPIILGGVCSEETLGANAAIGTNQSDVILISPTATSSEIAKLGDNIFSMYPSNTNKADKIAKYITGRKLSSLAIVVEDRSDSRNLVKEIESVYKGNVMPHYLVSEDEASTQDEINKIKEDDAMALLLAIQSPSLLGEILENLEAANWDKELILDERLISETEIISHYNDFLGNIPATGLDFQKEIKKGGPLDVFKKNYFKFYGWQLENDKYSLATLDAVDILLEALVTAKISASAKPLRTYLLNSQMIGASGGIKFDSTGIIDKEYFILRFNGEEFIPAE